MKKLTNKLTACALTGMAALHITPALAQEDRWFRVEVLVFANQANEPPQGSALAEQWEATPVLAYPSASRFLIDPAQVQQNSAEFQGDSLIDPFGRQIITILTAPEAAVDGAGGLAPPVTTAGTAPATAGGTAPAPSPLTPVYDDPALATSAPPQGAAPAPAVPAALPRPFVLLPGDYQEFRGKAALMQRSGRYSVLFHETWVQPVAGEDRSLPIVLDHSGDFQQWPLLQGTINIFLSRYLQLETNLWLNTPGEYLPGKWQMPAPPFGPPSLIIEEEVEIDLATAVGDLPGEPTPQGAVGSGETGVETGAGTAGGATAPTTDPNVPAAGIAVAGMAEPGETAQPPGPVYPFRHAVLLDQKRRMRSGETHYIDHPLLGMIVKFTPVTAEELSRIAQSQASWDTQAR